MVYVKPPSRQDCRSDWRRKSHWNSMGSRLQDWETNKKKFFTFEKLKTNRHSWRLTPKEISELVLEGIVTLCIVFLLYLGILVMVSQLINEPGFISVEFSAREVWHIERDQIVFYKTHLHDYISCCLQVAFTYWRLMRRYQQMQLNHILEELHLIADGQYDRRIPFRLSETWDKLWIRLTAW